MVVRWWSTVPTIVHTRPLGISSSPPTAVPRPVVRYVTGVLALRLLVIVVILVRRVVHGHRNGEFEGLNGSFAHSDVFSDADFDALVC